MTAIISLQKKEKKYFQIKSFFLTNLDFSNVQIFWEEHKILEKSLNIFDGLNAIASPDCLNF